MEGVEIKWCFLIRRLLLKRPKRAVCYGHFDSVGIAEGWLNGNFNIRVWHVSDFLEKDFCLMAYQMKELTSYNICYTFGILNILFFWLQLDKPEFLLLVWILKVWYIWRLSNFIISSIWKEQWFKRVKRTDIYTQQIWEYIYLFLTTVEQTL